MTPAPEDPRISIATALRMVTPLIAGVTPDQYGLPTPCDGMTVRDLLEHLVMAVRRTASTGRGEAPSTWASDAADVATGEWLAAFRAAEPEVLAAWTDEALDRPTAVPWGVFPGAEVLAIYTNELIVHGWDLARATGQQVDWDDAALETAWAAIHSQLPMADRSPMWEAMQAHLPPGLVWVDPFGPAMPVSDDAPLIDRLVAWNGRTP
jgi:uncharacterized protein (TIGR03086 family)